VPHGEFEVAGIVSAQPFVASQIEHGAEGEVRCLVVDHDWKSANQGDEFVRSRRHDPLVALTDRKSVGEFQMPQRRNLRVLTFEPV
jgi:hypothetical protein